MIQEVINLGKTEQKEHKNFVLFLYIWRYCQIKRLFLKWKDLEEERK